MRVWRFIRACKAYRSAYAKRLPQPGLPDQGPFPVRLQTAANAGAMPFCMAAWEDPRSSDPLAPFWVSAGVTEGLMVRGAPPLVRLARENGAMLMGLQLGDGALLVGIEGLGRQCRSAFPAAASSPKTAACIWFGKS